jgi:cytochrome c-type biogenesis protein CcmH/NrfG
MQSQCTKCSYEFEREMKFCPECGTQVTHSSSSEEKVETYTTSIILCSNCGEENPLKNKNCDGCGIKLHGVKKEKTVTVDKKSKPPYQKPSEPTQRKKIKSSKNKNQRIQKDIKGKNEFDSKKLFLIISTVGILVVIILLTTGVLDRAEVQTNNTPPNTNSGINLSNLSEINNLEQIVANNPADLSSLLTLANLQQDTGIFEKAINNYKKYLEVNPSDPDARIDMGVCYFSLSDHDNAIKEMEKALEFNPVHQIGHLNLGVVNLNVGNIDVAREWLRKAVEINPNSDAGKRSQSLLDSH